MDREEVMDQVKSIFLEGDLDLTEDRILFYWEEEIKEVDDLWSRMMQPSGTISVLLRFPNKTVAFASKTIVFEKVSRLINILNQKKKILFTIQGGNNDMNAHDNSEFKLIETTLPGGLIHDLIDPSRVACNPEVDHWVPAVVRSRTPTTATVPSESSPLEVVLSAMAPVFSWVPDVVRAITPTTTTVPLEFFSEIGGLPSSTNNLLLYNQLETVLTAMAPMFSDIGVNLTSNKHSKVLVKAQVYEFSSGEEYQGQLHREGLDQEKIAAVGLYYPLVDPGVKGGELLLCSVVRGGCGSEFPAHESVAVRPGTAVVFNNNLCFHQLLRTYGEGLRMVVGFFVIDPNCTLPASDMVVVNMEAKADRFLVEMESKVGIWLPEPIRQMIIYYVVGDLDMRFNAFRSRRLEPTTIGKLTRSACD